jgi:DNA polymerase
VFAVARRDPEQSSETPRIVPTPEFVPEQRELDALRTAAQRCQGCALYARATRVVFGEGPESATIMLVGEQPGDAEDKSGRPFVGPAGAMLDKALAEADIARARVYVTNAVKHFSFEPRGKARLHKKPRPGEVRACRPWLQAELETINPKVLVLLGATAAQSVLGAAFRVTRERGKVLKTNECDLTLASWHPSNILRAPDADARKKLFDELVTDLKLAASLLKGK